MCLVMGAWTSILPSGSFRRAGAERHARLLLPGSGVVLGEEGRRTASLLTEALGRQDKGARDLPS